MDRNKNNTLVLFISMLLLEFLLCDNAISEFSYESPLVETPLICSNKGDLSKLVGLDLSNIPICNLVSRHYYGWNGIRSEIIFSIVETNEFIKNPFYSNTSDRLPSDEFLSRIGIDRASIMLSGINYGSVMFGDNQEFISSYTINWFEVNSPNKPKTMITIYIDIPGKITVKPNAVLR